MLGSKKTLKMSVLLIVVFTYFSVSTVWADSALLKQGMSGSDVENLQQSLRALGYFNESVTGYFGNVTEVAVMKFQEDIGLDVDGIAGEDTLLHINKLLSATVNSENVLKKGMTGAGVIALQSALKDLGFFLDEVTGYFGEVTEQAVKDFQLSTDMDVDGVVGAQTMGAIERSMVDIASRGTQVDTNFLLSWSEVDNIFRKSSVASVYDIDSGKSFNIQRSYGTNHADSEPLTAEDTRILKEIYGGEWSWVRRAIIVEVEGVRIAASMIGMPHAGREDQPEGRYVNSRSGGYGYGYNYDQVKGNNMNGHICIHFYKSQTHNAGRQDSDHQAMVKKAAQWARDNYRN